MRVWLVDEQPGESGPALESALRQLAGRGRLALLGSGAFRPGLATELRTWQLDLVVVPEPCWPEGGEGQGLLELDVGVLVVAAEDRCERFLALAEAHPI